MGGTVAISQATKQYLAAPVLAVALANISIAAPTSFVHGASEKSPNVGATGSIEQQTKVAPSRPMRWFTKWFDSKPKSVVQEFSAPRSQPTENFAYQAPHATMPQLATSLGEVYAGSAPTTTNENLPTLPPRIDSTQEQTRAIVDRSQSLETSGQVDQARQALIEHLTKFSYDVRAIRALGHLEDRAGNLSQAELHYRQALGADPTQASSLNDLGLCLARQGRLDEAKVALKDAIQVNPKKELYRNNLAAVLIELDQNNEALTELQAVYSPATASYNLGQLLARSGRSQQSAELYKLALKIDPTYEPASRALCKDQAPVSPAAASAENESVTTESLPDITPITESSLADSQQEPKATETEMPEMAGAPSFPRLLPPVIER